MDIAEYQQLYLQAAYHYFREKAEWPGLRQIEKKILPTHRDFKVVEIARSLTESRYRTLITYNSNFQAILTIEQISKLQEAEQDLANFIKTIRFIADKYICSDADQVEVSSKDIRLHLQLDDLAIRKIAVLLHTTPVFASMTGSVDNSEWNLLISGNAIYFDGIQSIDDYKKKLDELSKSSTTGQVAQNVDSTIKKIAQADPSDIKTIGVSALELSTHYYNEPLKQSSQSFFLMCIAAVVCLLLFVAAIIFLTLQKRH